MTGVQFSGGGPEGLVVSQKLLIPTPQPGEVVIKVVCATANRADLVQITESATNAVDLPVVGVEASGYIEDASRQINTTFVKGDRVMALLSGGGNAEYVLVPETLVMLIPVTMSFSIAAAIQGR